MNRKTLQSAAAIFLFASIILLLCLEFILNLTPPLSRDALIHHLAVPKLWLKHGGIYEIPWANYAYYPMNINLLYVVCLYLKNDIAPKFIHFAFGMGTGFLIYFYLRSRFDRNCGLLGMLIFITTPIVIWLSTSAYVDLGMTFFTTASVMAFINWRDSEYSQFKWFLIASFCMGIAIGSKYNALIVWFIVNLMLMLSYVRDKNTQIGALKYGLMFFVITVLVASPWYLKNYFQTGNPFYPLFNSLFDSFQPHSVQKALQQRATEKIGQVGFFKLREVMYGESFWETLVIPIRMFFQGGDNSYQYFQGSLNPILIIFSPFIMLNKRYGKDKFVFVFFTVIFIFMAYFLTAKQVRYILPVLPFLAIIAVMGIKDLSDKMVVGKTVGASFRSGKMIQSIIKVVIFAIVASLLTSNLFYLKQRIHIINPLPYILKKESRDDFLRRHLLHYDAVDYINKTLPDDAAVFTMFLGGRGYYLNRNYKNEPSFGMNTIRQMVISSANEETFDNHVRSINVTHILVRSNLFYRFLHDNFSKTEINRLLNLINKRWTKLYDKNGYVVWEIHAKVP
jgi:Dolichyl-phosphate-mannose-protein mannosyltransferase